MRKVTKKHRIETARKIIDRNVIDVPFCTSDVDEFSDVCQQPIDGVVRKVNPQFYSDKRHVHMQIDGHWEARSWRKMITALTPEQEVKRVMRHLVWDEMRDFLYAAEPKECQRCGTYEDLSVDHVAPPFDEIANAFISMHGLPDIKKSDDPTCVVNMFSEIDMESEWIQFHASHATYQLLCRSCNASKGKRA